MTAAQRMAEIDNLIVDNMKAGLSGEEVSELLAARYGYTERDAMYIVLGVVYLKSKES